MFAYCATSGLRVAAVSDMQRKLTGSSPDLHAITCIYAFCALQPQQSITSELHTWMMDRRCSAVQSQNIILNYLPSYIESMEGISLRPVSNDEGLKT